MLEILCRHDGDLLVESIVDWVLELPRKLPQMNLHLPAEVNENFELHLWRTLDYLRIRKYPVQTNGLVLCRTHRNVINREYRLWQKLYLPRSGVQGLCILDVGAGCGETALFYKKHGARKVIGVEPAAECAANCRINGFTDIVEEAPFSLSMLKKYHFDLMKMDGEGCEKELLKLDVLPSFSVIEVHSKELRDALTSKFHLKMLLPSLDWTGGEVSILCTASW